MIVDISPRASYDIERIGHYSAFDIERIVDSFTDGLIYLREQPNEPLGRYLYSEEDNLSVFVEVDDNIVTVLAVKTGDHRDEEL